MTVKFCRLVLTSSPPLISYLRGVLQLLNDVGLLIDNDASTHSLLLDYVVCLRPFLREEIFIRQRGLLLLSTRFEIFARVDGVIICAKVLDVDVAAVPA